MPPPLTRPLALARKRKPYRGPGNRHPGPPRQPSGGSQPARGRRTDLQVVSVGGGAWKLRYPPCVAERADDIAEVESMIEVGELDAAVDELRWLLEGCSDLLAAHQLLGTVALEEGDFALGRGHFGIVYDLVRESLPHNFSGTLPYSIEENQVIHESGRGLAHCLRKLEQNDLARSIVEQLLKWDSSDPVKVGGWLAG